MKDLLFTTDLVTLLRHDKFYGTPKNLSAALRKFGLRSICLLYTSDAADDASSV